MYTNQLIDFIEKSPTAFHAAEQLANMLTQSGAKSFLKMKAGL